MTASSQVGAASYLGGCSGPERPTTNQKQLRERLAPLTIVKRIPSPHNKSQFRDLLPFCVRQVRF